MDLELADVIAKSAVADIIDDMTDRGGFRHMWDSLDEATKTEIRSSWEEIVERKLRAVAYDNG